MSRLSTPKIVLYFWKGCAGLINPFLPAQSEISISASSPGMPLQCPNPSDRGWSCNKNADTGASHSFPPLPRAERLRREASNARHNQKCIPEGPGLGAVTGCYSPSPPPRRAPPAHCRHAAKTNLTLFAAYLAQLKRPVKASAIRSERNYRAKYPAASKNDTKGAKLENKKRERGGKACTDHCCLACSFTMIKQH